MCLDSGPCRPNERRAATSVHRSADRHRRASDHRQGRPASLDLVSFFGCKFRKLLEDFSLAHERILGPATNRAIIQAA
jgi:hypothetical protein